MALRHQLKVRLELLSLLQLALIEVEDLVLRWQILFGPIVIQHSFGGLYILLHLGLHLVGRLLVLIYYELRLCGVLLLKLILLLKGGGWRLLRIFELEMVGICLATLG